MKLHTLAVRSSLVVILASLLLLIGIQASAQTQPASTPAAQVSAVPARITQPIDETQLVTLKGNVHPLARPQFDQGPVSDAMTANRMLLLLQRSSEQEAALQQLLEDQQNQASANFHKWLTPVQFGTQFGPADSDIQTVTNWLTSKGFHDIKIGAGRTVIEFSGNVGQVRSAFHTDIHTFVINGQERHANTSDPQIPAALVPVVKGLAGLHNFPPKSQVHPLGTFRKDKDTGRVEPLFTFSGGLCGSNNGTPNTCLGIGPTDFATIYNVAPLWTAGIDGTGETIALVGDSNINPQDVVSFRTMFGLPMNISANTPQIIVNGPDPGPNGDEDEADLDTQWAGAVAKNAQIVLVVTQQPDTIGAAGVDLSAQYIIDNNTADVMSESFGNCEAATNNQLEFLMWEEASALGIGVMTAAGDTGSASCDNQGNFPGELAATQGLAVSGTASTPFNVAVGGTDFNATLTNYGTTYWNATNTATTEASAKSYIPEIVWNDSCTSFELAVPPNCTASVIESDAENFGPGADIIGGGGGSSAVYTGAANKPSYQSGFGDANRDLPDVVLMAGNGFNGSFYILCEVDANAAQGGNASSCDLNSPFLDFQGVGGTSASSPTFAAIMALADQKKGGRQGNPNYTLYSMYRTAANVCVSNPTTAASPGSCIFYDIPAGSGNNSVACAGNSSNCSNQTAGTGEFGFLATTNGGSTPAYDAAAGYDLATGLGSVNAANLVNNWTPPNLKLSATSFLLNGGTPVSGITNGAAVTVSGAVTGTGGTPTGVVTLIQGTTFPGTVIDSFALTNGTYSGTTTLLPATASGYSVVVHYGGDGVFGSSNSSAQMVNSVAKENSDVTVSFVIFTSATTFTQSTQPQTVAYGSPYILRYDVTNTSNQPCSTNNVPCPTGAVTTLDSGNPLKDFLVPGTTTLTNTANLVAGVLEDQNVQLTGGSHGIAASYAGDSNFNSQATSNTLSVTITKAATQISGLLANPSTGISTTSPVTLTATILAPLSGSLTGTTGTVTFFNNGTAIGSPATVTPVAATQTAPAGGIAALTTIFTTNGTEVITAQYNGDTNYAASAVSSSISITVGSGGTGSFTLAAGAASVTTTAGSGTSSGTSTITETPAAGFSGVVTLACGTAVPGVSCSGSIAAGSTSGSLAVNVNNPSSSTTTSGAAAPAVRKLRSMAMPLSLPGGGSGWWTLSATAGLAALILLFVPGRKRYRVAFSLGLICAVSFAMGCGGGSGGGGGGGLTATTTTLTVSATKLAANGTLTVSATVTGGSPTGAVQFIVDGTSLGSSPTSGGSTGNITVTAANAPAFLPIVGTHTLVAQYVGDSTTAASTSGTLNITVTGPTNLPITGTSGSANATANVALTIK